MPSFALRSLAEPDPSAGLLSFWEGLMADYHTLFSCHFDVGTTQNAEAAQAIFDQLEMDLDEEDGATIGFAMSFSADHPGNLWLHDIDNYGEPEHVIAFVLRCAEAFQARAGHAPFEQHLPQHRHHGHIASRHPRLQFRARRLRGPRSARPRSGSPRVLLAASRPAKPRTLVRGVLNSWLILARKSDFACSDASARSFASRRRRLQLLMGRDVAAGGDDIDTLCGAGHDLGLGFKPDVVTTGMS